jgi:hypothetical protein
MSRTETLERIDVSSSGIFNYVIVFSSYIHGTLTPLQKQFANWSGKISIDGIPNRILKQP